MAITETKLLRSVHNADVNAFLKVVNLNSRTPVRSSALALSHTADGWLYPFFPLVAAFFDPNLALVLFGVLATGYVVERILYLILKKGIKRNRPPNALPGFRSVIEASDEFSFPSGHTSAAFLAVTTVAQVFPGAGFEIAYIWATMVALSRVVLGVHFPLDTVAGAILGSTVSLITCALLI